MAYWGKNSSPASKSTGKRPIVPSQEKTGGLPKTATVRGLIKQSIPNPKENEFFFTTHSNIGICEEFERLVKYINENSNIPISIFDNKSIVHPIEKRISECNFIYKKFTLLNY